MIRTATLPAATDAGIATLRAYQLREGVYRAEVIGLGGGAVDEFCRSYPSAQQALHHYNVAVALFANGMTIREVRYLVHLFNPESPAVRDLRSVRPGDLLPCEESQ